VEIPVEIYLVIGDGIVEPGVLAASWVLVIMRFVLAIIFATIIALVVNEFVNDGRDGNNEVFTVEHDLVQVTFKVDCFPVKGLHIQLGGAQGEEVLDTKIHLV
jgi:uncharacterized membrane protein YraQ (UPF0718 family)